MNCCGLWAFLNSQLLGTFILLLTLIVLGIYAWDTRRIASASLKQIEIAQGERLREDKRALAGVAIMLLEYSTFETLYVDKASTDLERERWRLLSGIARAISTIEAKEYLSLCAEVARFISSGGKPSQAAILAKEAFNRVRPDLIEEIKRADEGKGGAN